MKRGVTPGKVAVVTSSLLLVGTYIAGQAGILHLPFLSRRGSEHAWVRDTLGGSQLT